MNVLWLPLQLLRLYFGERVDHMSFHTCGETRSHTFFTTYLFGPLETALVKHRMDDMHRTGRILCLQHFRI